MSVPLYRCRRTARPIRIDADLSKPEWRDAEEAGLVETETGQPPKQATTVRMLHDDAHLYFGFHVVDRDIWGTHREDGSEVWREDAVEMFIDPFGPGRVYFELDISPHNVLFDALVLNRTVPPDGPRDIVALQDWNCGGLRRAVAVAGELDTRRGRGEYWDVEVAVPFHDLAAPHCPPEPGEEWRVNLYRVDHAPDGDEYQAWSPTGRVDFHVPWRFGRVRFEQ